MSTPNIATKSSVEFDVTNIPEELKSLPSWVMWKPKWVEGKNGKEGKWTKVPYQVNGSKAASTRPAEWNDFKTVADKAAGTEFGIGFMLGEVSGLIGIDFDKSLVNEDYLRWIGKFASYTEISPSGNGYRVFGFGEIPDNFNRGGVECYNSVRFLTVTGNILPDSPKTVRNIDDVVEEFFEEFAPDKLEKNKKAPTAIPESQSFVTPGMVLARIDLSRDQGDFDILYNGGGDADTSKADYDMFKILAYWCRKDAILMKQIAINSMRVRDKWQHQRGTGTWLDYEISAAIQAVNNAPTPYIEGEKPDGKKIKEDNDGLSDGPEDERGSLAYFNARYGTTMLFGKFRVLSDAALNLATGDPFTEFIIQADFRANYPGDGGKWLNSPRRRRYDRVWFEPRELPSSVFNLWRGFAVEPIQNDAKIEKYWAHIRENVCNDKEEDFLWFKAWCAQLIQRPWEPAGVAIGMGGEEGTGKGIVVNALGKLLGDSYLPTSRIDQIVGKFNGQTHNKILLYSDESFWAGDKTTLSALKALITEPTTVIQYKNVERQIVNNYAHLIFTSNEEHFIPININGERRFSVFDVSNQHAMDLSYFQPLCDDLKSGGYEALLYDLQNFDYRELGINPKIALQSDGLVEQKILSAPSHFRYMLECVEKGVLVPGFEEEKEGYLALTPFFETYRSKWMRDQPERGHEVKETLGKLLTAMFGQSQRKRIKVFGQAIGQSQVYFFGDLENFEREIEHKLRQNGCAAR